MSVSAGQESQWCLNNYVMIWRLIQLRHDCDFVSRWLFCAHNREWSSVKLNVMGLLILLADIISNNNFLCWSHIRRGSSICEGLNRQRFYSSTKLAWNSTLKALWQNSTSHHALSFCLMTSYRISYPNWHLRAKIRLSVEMLHLSPHWNKGTC